MRLYGQHGGIEALQVAGLQDALALFCARNQVVRLGQRGGQGLFDQQVEAGIEQRRGNRMMVHRWNGHSGGVQLQIGRQQFVWRGEDGNRVFGCVFGGAGCVRLNGGNQGDALPAGLQFAVDAEMVLAKGAGSGDGNAQRGFVHYRAAPFSGPLPSTTFRQRL